MKADPFELSSLIILLTLTMTFVLLALCPNVVYVQCSHNDFIKLQKLRTGSKLFGIAV